MLISLSLTALILTDGIILGMVELMVGGITKTIAGEVQLHKRGFLDNFDPDLFMESPGRSLQLLDSEPAVSGYAPRVITGGMIASTYNTAGALIYGVDAERELGVSKISDAIVTGAYLSGGEREILLGIPLAEILEVTLGDRIVITGAEVGTGEIAQELFRVTGLFEFGPDEYDEHLVFINLSAAQKLLAMNNGLHEIAVQFHDPEDAKNTRLPLLQQLNTDDIEALGWLNFNASVGAMIEMTNYSTLIIGTVLFLLASLGVINSMFMSIYERIYEIGVLKAIGSKPNDIIMLILCEALLLAVISAVLGALLALGLGSYFAEHGIALGEELEMEGVNITNIHPRFIVSQFVAFPIYVTLLTLAAAIYPARFASRIIPSEALQRSL